MAAAEQQHDIVRGPPRLPRSTLSNVLVPHLLPTDAITCLATRADPLLTPDLPTEEIDDACERVGGHDRAHSVPPARHVQGAPAGAGRRPVVQYGPRHAGADGEARGLRCALQRVRDHDARIGTGDLPVPHELRSGEGRAATARVYERQVGSVGTLCRGDAGGNDQLRPLCAYRRNQGACTAQGS